MRFTPIDVVPARNPSLIMGNRVPLGCNLFKFLVQIHNYALLVLSEIHSSRSIHFAEVSQMTR